jgi:hypothetical protein
MSSSLNWPEDLRGSSRFSARAAEMHPLNKPKKHHRERKKKTPGPALPLPIILYPLRRNFKNASILKKQTTEPFPKPGWFWERLPKKRSKARFFQ